MTTRTRRTLQVAVVALGAFFLIAELAVDGVSPWDFVPVVGVLLGLVAIEQVHRNHERRL
ncbi:hypothetical protein [Nocardioides okcheonensis]|uniref:hypothetical protein n=1 Tax=Nocardioides okcheonensis TaxID=2894081 RepID=UPI001E546810|nr:hypothetical protein [Nocardioides okcheonensis]UFN45913.1 hypothetical protein LN652_06815 [Nocardioides okcheonensis]